MASNTSANNNERTDKIKRILFLLPDDLLRAGGRSGELSSVSTISNLTSGLVAPSGILDIYAAEGISAVQAQYRKIKSSMLFGIARP
jgi:hypothetical protein